MAVMSPDLAGDTHGWDHPIAAMLCGSGCTPAFGDSWAPVLAPACVHPILLPPAPFSWDRSVPSPGCVPALLWFQPGAGITPLWAELCLISVLTPGAAFPPARSLHQ